METKFEENLKTGKVGEDIVSKWLISRGWLVMPVYEISEGVNKGPRVFSSIGKIIAPDAMVFRGTESRWVEVKYKTGFVDHRITQKAVTGMDIKCYTHYLEVSRLSGKQVWIFFLQRGKFTKDSSDCESGLFAQEISVLQKKEHSRNMEYGLVFWDKKDLIKLATIEDVMSAQ